MLSPRHAVRPHWAAAVRLWLGKYRFRTCAGTWRRVSYNSCQREPLLLLVPVSQENFFSRAFLLLPNVDRPLLLTGER